jgi:hypothetical protein
LFANGEQGWWYDPSNFATLFQDSAGTTPVTAVEQPVGLQLDLSKGLVLGPELVTNGDGSAGLTGWTTTTWTVNGSGQFTASTGTLAQSNVVTVGKWYAIEFDQIGPLVNTLNVFCGIGSVTAFTLASAAGRKSLKVLAAGDTRLIFQANGANTTVDNITVKELPGNHRFQSTSANRPVVSARVNLLTKTEDFSDAVWTKTATTVTANSTTAPDGTTTADTLTPTVVGFSAVQSFNIAGTYTASVSVKNNGAGSCLVAMGGGAVGYLINVNLTNGAFISGRSYGGGSLVSYSISDQGNGWYRISLTVTATVGGILVGAADGTTPTQGVFVWGADVRPTNQGVGLPAYQRVNTSTDYDSTGFPVYIKPNGSNQFMVTNSINFTATDKMTVWQGVRKLSDAYMGIVGLSADTAANAGSFELASFAGSFSYLWDSKGTVSARANTSGYAAPITNVVTCLGDISGDRATLRVNGAQVAQSTADQGTGNYGTYPAYFYTRGGTTLFSSGHDYGSIARGAASTAAQITAGETYINSKTKAY